MVLWTASARYFYCYLILKLWCGQLQPDIFVNIPDKHGVVDSFNHTVINMISLISMMCYNTYSGVIGCGSAEATGLGCFIVNILF